LANNKFLYHINDKRNRHDKQGPDIEDPLTQRHAIMKGTGTTYRSSAQTLANITSSTDTDTPRMK
jgi:hypothetical protein